MKLSIITINYNNAVGLRKTLASVAAQTYRDIEHVIVDAASMDGISTHPMFYRGKIAEYKPVTIGNNVFIGANVTVLDGVTIGDGAVIGAGSVVSKYIPPYAIAVGCPIEIKRYRLTEKQIAAMERIQWWNWEEEKLKDVQAMFNDIEAFIEKYDK